MDITDSIIPFILTFTRAASFIMVLPFLRSPTIPVHPKLVFALAIAFVGHGEVEAVEVESIMGLIAQIFVQLAVGISMAFIVDIVLSSARVAGSIIDMDMALSSSEFMDPGSGISGTIVANMFNYMIIIIFLAIGGLNQLVMAMAYSFKFMDVELFMFQEEFVREVIAAIGYMIVSGIQIAMPFMATIFIANIVIMFLAKSAPQINIFMNMFAVKVGLGFLFIFLSMPVVAGIFNGISDQAIQSYYELIQKWLDN